MVAKCSRTPMTYLTSEFEHLTHASLVIQLLPAAGGGDVKIESHKVSFREKAQSKVASMDNVSHSPGGGDVKVSLSTRTPTLASVFTVSLKDAHFLHPLVVQW